MGKKIQEKLLVFKRRTGSIAKINTYNVPSWELGGGGGTRTEKEEELVRRHSRGKDALDKNTEENASRRGAFTI